MVLVFGCRAPERDLKAHGGVSEKRVVSYPGAFPFVLSCGTNYTAKGLNKVGGVYAACFFPERPHG